MQPTVVGEAAVVHLVVRDKTDFEIGLRQSDGSGRAIDELGDAGAIEINRSHGVSRVGEQTIVQETTEHFIGVAASNGCDGREHVRITVGLGFAQNTSEDFDFGHAAEKRQNHRLDRHDRAVGGASIAPRFQIVRGGEVRAGLSRSLIGVITEAHNVADGFLQRGPIQFGRSVVCGIAAEHNEGLDGAGLDSGGEIGDRRGLAGGNFDEIDRTADVAEGGVDRVRDGVDGRGLMRTGDDKRRPFVVQQISRALGEPLGLRVETLGEFGERSLAGDFFRERRGEREDVAAREAQAMIGHRAGQRERALRHIKAVHRIVFLGDATTFREFAGVI